MRVDDIELRPTTGVDLPTLLDIYAHTRQEEMAQTDWSAERQAQFLKNQFMAQLRHYKKQFPDAHFQIMHWQDQVIGRLTWRLQTDFLHLIDISLLPAFRSQGLGGKIIRHLQSLAREKACPFKLMVEVGNPALRLYERLGFRVTGNEGIYFTMQWNP